MILRLIWHVRVWSGFVMSIYNYIGLVCCSLSWLFKLLWYMYMYLDCTLLQPAKLYTMKYYLIFFRFWKCVLFSRGPMLFQFFLHILMYIFFSFQWFTIFELKCNKWINRRHFICILPTLIQIWLLLKWHWIFIIHPTAFVLYINIQGCILVQFFTGVDNSCCVYCSTPLKKIRMKTLRNWWNSFWRRWYVALTAVQCTLINLSHTCILNWHNISYEVCSN